MLKDKFGQCIACYFSPCRCFGRETRDTCSSCEMLRDEVKALRDELKLINSRLELERDRKAYLETELMRTRVPPFRGMT